MPNVSVVKWRPLIHSVWLKKLIHRNKINLLICPILNFTSNVPGIRLSCEVYIIRAEIVLCWGTEWRLMLFFIFVMNKFCWSVASNCLAERCILVHFDFIGGIYLGPEILNRITRSKDLISKAQFFFWEHSLFPFDFIKSIFRCIWNWGVGVG